MVLTVNVARLMNKPSVHASPSTLALRPHVDLNVFLVANVLTTKLASIKNVKIPVQEPVELTPSVGYITIVRSALAFTVIPEMHSVDATLFLVS